jgi:hypothetical protein
MAYYIFSHPLVVEMTRKVNLPYSSTCFFRKRSWRGLAPATTRIRPVRLQGFY